MSAFRFYNKEQRSIAALAALRRQLNLVCLTARRGTGGIMDRCRQHLLLRWMIAVVAMNVLGNNAKVVEADKLQVKNVTNRQEVIPYDGKGTSINKLVIEKNQITLNEQDRLALAHFPKLVELHLDDNLVTNIPAHYFSVAPHLRVLSLSGNMIHSLDSESFSGLNDLTELNLSNNLLTSLPSQLFRGLKHLQVLKLQGNPWNCSCPLLSSIREIKETGVRFAGPPTKCVSPKRQAGKDLLEATAKCYPSPPPSSSSTADPKNPVNFQQHQVPITLPKTTLTSSTTKNLGINKDQTPVLGNTWKFTACVAASTLCIFMLIVGAIKGPSWYKLFHNYRHKRLQQEEDGREDTVSTVFSETGRHVSHQTFTFKQDDGQVEEEEEEDGYFEDPYIKREE
ncbi:leucine-rich repeat-containing protein 19-like isoform X2 [Thunnus albacares]|uniref:leucine-rich repeat-containing protein 19-like isoform X2 n=1 Tax=Thunnus albacares TaxID=8236 RepID=UPI001CF6F131|nr:leucine-rich repeat-containing protein 19-like isoform X2 [Thunnus albacares]